MRSLVFFLFFVSVLLRSFTVSPCFAGAPSSSLPQGGDVTQISASAMGNRFLNVTTSFSEGEFISHYQNWTKNIPTMESITEITSRNLS